MHKPYLFIYLFICLFIYLFIYLFRAATNSQSQRIPTLCISRFGRTRSSFGPGFTVCFFCRSTGVCCKSKKERKSLLVLGILARFEIGVFIRTRTTVLYKCTCTKTVDKNKIMHLDSE